MDKRSGAVETLHADFHVARIRPEARSCAWPSHERKESLSAYAHADTTASENGTVVLLSRCLGEALSVGGSYATLGYELYLCDGVDPRRAGFRR